jgi:hypothetical protein
MIKLDFKGICENCFNLLKFNTNLKKIVICGQESVMVFPLDLQDFLLRARVFKLYRQALRTTRRAPVQARGHNSILVSEILV